MYLEIILSILSFIFSIRLFIKGYKDSENDFEKVLYILLSLAMWIPLIVYLLDRYNIPTKLGCTKNIISSDWVNILTNYSAAIVSTLISAVFLIFVTSKQMEKTYKDNIKLNNETQRLQNLPFLRYSFTRECIERELVSEDQEWMDSDQSSSGTDDIDFILKIENIGLNTVRKVFFEIKSNLFHSKKYVELCNQSNIEKNQIKTKEFIILNVAKGTYQIEITVYYQDLLKNWYKQKIILNVSVTNRHDSKGCSYINSFTVEDEEEIAKEPSALKKLRNKSTL